MVFAAGTRRPSARDAANALLLRDAISPQIRRLLVTQAIESAAQ